MIESLTKSEKHLTSYDLLKTLAIILMIVDHAGHHFFPDEMWFRVIGRLCLPIWFFLIGYARSTDIPKSWWIGGVIVGISAAVSGQYILPLSILFTMALMRYFRKFCVRSLASGEALRGLFFILVLMTWPTAIIFEYGTSAMLLVLFGYMMRNRDAVQECVPQQYMTLYIVSAMFVFFFIQGVNLPHVSALQAVFMLVGYILIGVVLWRFRPVVYADAGNIMSRSFVRMFQFMGRRTLEIYVVHIIIFRAVAMYLYPEQYPFLEWKIAPAGMVDAFM